MRCAVSEGSKIRTGCDDLPGGRFDFIHSFDKSPILYSGLSSQRMNIVPADENVSWRKSFYQPNGIRQWMSGATASSDAITPRGSKKSFCPGMHQVGCVIARSSGGFALGLGSHGATERDASLAANDSHAASPHQGFREFQQVPKLGGGRLEPAFC